MSEIPRTDKNMVVGIDGSPESSNALSWAAARTSEFGLIQPVSTWRLPWWAVSAPLPGSPLPPPTDEFEREVRDAAERELADVPSRLRLPPIVCRGSAGPTLVATAKGASLLVVGTRGRGAAADTFLGSVSVHCASHSEVPVAIVPTTAPVTDEHQRMVVAVDGSATSVDALVWAIDHAHDDSAVEVVHVWNFSSTASLEPALFPTDRIEAEARQILDETVAKAKVDAGGTRHELISRLEFGDPRSVLQDLVVGSDQLVMGAQGHRGLAHLLLGSVTSAMIHQPLVTTIVVPSRHH